MSHTKKDAPMAVGFLDIHHHLLYGLDEDGPRTFADTCAMLKAAHEDGISTLIATPHVIPGIAPFPLDVYLQRLEEAQQHCRQEGIPIKILPGCEILYTEMTVRHLQDRRIPTLANSDYVLVEFPPNVQYGFLAKSLTNLLRHGFIPILAHIERYACLLYHPWRAISLRKKLNIRYQINCSSLWQREHFFMALFFRWMLSREGIDYVATDAHNIHSRKPSMKQAYKALSARYDNPYVDGLIHNTEMGL